MSSPEVIDPDEIEYMVTGLLAKKVQIQKQSFVDAVKMCSCPNVRQYFISKETAESTLTSMLDILVDVISRAAKEPSLKHVRYYALICLVILSKDIEVRCTNVDLSKVVVCLVKFLKKAIKDKGGLSPEKDISLCMSCVRKPVEQLFKEEHGEDQPYTCSFDALQWLNLLNEIDLAVLVLSNLLHHHHARQDEREERVVKKLQEVVHGDGGDAFSVLLEALAVELMDWMTKEKDVTLWRLGTLFQLFSKCVSHCEEGKDVLSRLAKQNGSFSEIFNIIKSCNDKLVKKSGSRHKETVVYCLLSGSRLLVDLTHRCQAACDMVGVTELELLLDMLVYHSQNDPCKQEKSGHEHSWQFDFSLILLSILSNCTERTPANRKRLGLLKNGAGCQHVVDVFVRTLPNDVVKALKTAAISEEIEFGWDAEQLILSSYATLLLGCLMRENQTNRMKVLKHIPGHSPVILIHILRASVSFQKDANVLTEEALAATSEIMEEFEGMLTKTGTATKNKENLVKPKRVQRPAQKTAKRKEQARASPEARTDVPSKPSPKKQKRGMISLDDIF